MTPAANSGFQPAAGRHNDIDVLDSTTGQVTCGHCGRPVPSGTACIVVNYHAHGWHQMFCPDHVPDGTRPWRGDPV